MNLMEWKSDLSSNKDWSDDGNNEMTFVHNDTKIIIGWFCDIDWNYYSKSYGKPKKTFSNAHVRIERGDRKVIYPLDGFRGNFLIEPIRKFFKIKASVKPNAITINKYMRAKEQKRIANFVIFERTIAKIPYDYCIVNNVGVTFHSHDIKLLADGLRRKLGSSIKSIKAYDLPLAKKLGFCDEGTNDFIEHYHLNHKGTYSRCELRKRILEDPSCAIKYPNEVKKLKLFSDAEIETFEHLYKEYFQ